MLGPQLEFLIYISGLDGRTKWSAAKYADDTNIASRKVVEVVTKNLPQCMDRSSKWVRS